jgi:VCBS repeat-containing protein
VPRTLVLILVSLTLAGCGGGGGSGSGTPSPPNPPSNGAPVVSSTTFNATEDTDLAATLTATDPDNDAITFTKTGDPAHGQIVAFQANGAFTYRPTANYNGADSFTIRASDTASHQVAATISITVAAVNDAPTIKDDVATVTAANPVVDVLANDVDPDGDALTLTIESGPAYGTASVVNGKVQLTLPPGFKAFNRFTYRAVDGGGLGGTATAAVFVDTQPVRLIYQSNEENGAQNLYVDDLIRPRRISALTPATVTFLGHSNVSANGRTVLFEEATGNLSTSYKAQSIWTAPADGSSATRQISATLQTGEQLNVRSALSPDGRWVVYGVTASGGTETLYLANLAPGGTAVPIAVPAGAVKIESASQGILFGPTSQYVYLTASSVVSGSVLGQATYRIPVSDPTAAVRLSPPAIADRQIAVVLVSSDETRALDVLVDGTTPSIARTDIAPSGSTTVIVSHAIGASERLIGIDADPALTHVAYIVDRQTTPDAFDLYVANTSVASSGIPVAQLPADVPSPQLHGVSPNGDAALFSTVRITGTAVEQLLEIGLTAGATPQLIQQRPLGNTRYGYVDAGQSIAFTGNPGVSIAPRGNPAGAQVLFAKDTVLYELSPDSQVLAAITSNTDPSPLHLWLVNRGTSTPLQITGLTDPTSKTLSIRVVPAN